MTVAPRRLPREVEELVEQLAEVWDLLDLDEQEAAAEEIAALERHAAEHPLAYADLWHRDEPGRTSQREAVRAVLAPGVENAFILGGNRSGKSRARAMLAVAMALGGDHPDVVAWLTRNDLPLDAIPKGPGEHWTVALDSNDSRNYVRPADAEWMPIGTRWRNREGAGEAEAHLPNGGLIRFKDVAQGADGFQGAAPRSIGFDEEPRDVAVVREAGMRLVDHAGLMFFAMTPLYGWTDLLRAHIPPRAPASPATVVRWLHGADNPHIRADVLLARVSKHGSHEQAARLRGEITALEGRVYPQWEQRAPWVVPARPLPASWPRFEGVDWGTAVPTCVLLAAFDESTGTVHVIGEIYATQMTLQARADRIRELERLPAEGPTPAVVVRWADPAQADTNISMTLDHDLQMTSAHKAVRWGISVVANALQLDALGATHLVIHDSCPNLISEMLGYVWADEGKESVRKQDDHAVDALRYLLCGLARMYGIHVPPTAEEIAEADLAIAAK